MTTKDPVCPNCGEDSLYRECVDVGVGIIYSPYGCPVCKYSEDEAYNLSSGPKVSDSGSPVDQFGGVYPGLKMSEVDRWTNESSDMFTGLPEEE